MGDHRADVKIHLEMHGKTYTHAMWINWTPDDDGCDRRVTEWFADCWEDAKARYEAKMRESYDREHAAETERVEREQLARLKAKYGDGS